MFERFSDRARKVIALANQEAFRLDHGYIGTEHILLGIVKEGSGIAAKALMDAGIDLRRVRVEVEKLVKAGPDMPTQGKLPQTPRAKQILEFASEESAKLGQNFVDAEHLLLALLRENDGVAIQALTNLGVDRGALRETVVTLAGAGPYDLAPVKDHPAAAASKTPALDLFGRDLTLLADSDQLDPFVGRQPELERVIQILCRRQRNNPVLVGKVGVGKSAIVNGLAIRMAAGAVPAPLQDCRLVVLELSSMIAGTQQRGQPEERIHTAMNEVRRSKNIVLVIPEFRHLAEAGVGISSPYGLLRCAAARGDVRCISADTLQAYREHIQRDWVLARHFEPCHIEPPSNQETLEILRALRSRFESHHRVQIEDAALETAVELSCLFIPDRNLPEKAITTVDDAGALLQLAFAVKPPRQAEIESEIQRLTTLRDQAVNNADYGRAAELRDRAEALRKELESILISSRKEDHGIVTADLVCTVVSRATGIPLEQIQKRDASAVSGPPTAAR